MTIHIWIIIKDESEFIYAIESETNRNRNNAHDCKLNLDIEPKVFNVLKSKTKKLFGHFLP